MTNFVVNNKEFVAKVHVNYVSHNKQWLTVQGN